MEYAGSKSSCTLWCMIIAGAIGLIAFLLLLVVFDWRLLSAIMLAGVIAAIGAVVFPIAFCSNTRGLVAPGTAGVGAGAAPTVAARKPAAAPQAAAAASAPVAATPKAEEKKAEPKPAAAPKPKPAATSESAASSADESEPEILTAARAGGADDLKKIKGVGPQLEKTLNEMGFYHFDQIAKWSKKEVAWVDARLKFKGRIERDEWIKQSKELAKG